MKVILLKLFYRIKSYSILLIIRFFLSACPGLLWDAISSPNAAPSSSASQWPISGPFNHFVQFSNCNLRVCLRPFWGRALSDRLCNEKMQTLVNKTNIGDVTRGRHSKLGESRDPGIRDLV